ncbi:excinuclease ABC subunit UvrC [Acetobacteraceae bacterium]|nr:excinuclease ABC subunit UvrC [Acetobacteraceae bacterium]
MSMEKSVFLSSNEKNHVIKGVEAIQNALKTIPFLPGVYRMLDEKGQVLYVGKALSLKKRVTSYTRLNALPDRIRLMVSLTVSMEIVVTANEAEALLQEANFIRRMKPRFNILLRDDKSYPWLMLDPGKNPDFPRLVRQRGKQRKGITYWGPFASAWAAEQTLQVLQRSFLLRTCSDSTLKSRTRPCLLHQIKRCSAPCVDKITPDQYAGLVEEAKAFLAGSGASLQQKLGQEMAEASDNLNFEKAALLRDRLRAFGQIRSSKAINPASIVEADVIALYQDKGRSCIQVFFIRGGNSNGNRAFYPEHDSAAQPTEILSAFLGQFYEDKLPPREIILNEYPEDEALLIEALEMRRGKKVFFRFPQRGERKAVLDYVLMNAKEALARYLSEKISQEKILKQLQEAALLKEIPERIEIYDNSHIMGTSPYGVMVVAGREGFLRNAYRKFAIQKATPGDDFGMMKEVMERRFLKMNEEELQGEGNHWTRPNLLLIDGGKGQVSAVKEILKNMGISDIPVMGIAKGPDRNAGREWFFVDGKAPFQLPPQDLLLYYLQRLRDEAHRFAITTHRKGRGKAFLHSKLQDIPGVGNMRRRALMSSFGSLKNISQATVEELAQVSGVSQRLSQEIYEYFHMSEQESETDR